MKPVPLLILLLAAMALVWLWWSDGRPPPASGGRGSDDPGDDAHLAQQDNGQQVRATVERRVVDNGEGPVAGEANASLRIVVHGSLAPVAGAAVMGFGDGARLGVSGEDGIVSMSLQGATQVVVAADGYLMRLVGLRAATILTDPAVVELVPDVYTIAQRFRFVDGERNVLERVFVRFRPDWREPEGASPLAGLPTLPAGTPNPVLRAWNDHVLIAATASTALGRVHAGHMSSSRTYPLSGEDGVRFTQAGTYQLHAATSGGLVGRAVFQVSPGAGTLTVPMGPGGSVVGVAVAAESGRPLAGARVALLGGDPLDTHAVTDAEGRFALSPVAPGALTLEVTHRHRETLIHGPVFPEGELLLHLVALAQRTLRGTVRARPSLKGLAGAEVIAGGGQDEETQTNTDVQGRFELAVPASGMVSLTIRAAGHLPYAEILAPDAGDMAYDLLPARVEDRVRAGLSALLVGTVVDQNGAPAPGVAVRLQPDRPELPGIRADRRVLEGGVLAPPLTVKSDTAGAFRLETAQEGPARLFVQDDSSPSAGLALVIRRGEVIEGLRPVTRKRP